MMRMKWAFGWIFISFYSWGQPLPVRISTEQYIEKYYVMAVREMHRTRIPASITLAQGILESGSGNSRLTQQGNNHFGIKCKGNWTGPTILEDDDEKQECFRAYDSAWQSFRDHSDFLLKNSRYAFLFDFEPTDYVQWANGLKKAGYATNPAYAEMLIRNIEKYHLEQFDKMPADGIDAVIKQNMLMAGKEKWIDWNGMPAVIITGEESWQSLAMENDMRVWQIFKYNDLPDSAVLHKGDTIYLKPKRNKPEQEYHWVKSGETLHQISQRFGIKLKKLRTRNLLEEGQEPEVGEKIYLKENRPAPPKLKIIKPVPPSSSKIIKTSPPLFHPDKKTTDSFPSQLAYVIKPADTPEMIASKYGITLEILQKLNPNSTFQKGEVLILPSRKHKVLAGETVYRIAKNYGIPQEDLVKWNKIQNNQVYIGQLLIIP